MDSPEAEPKVQVIIMERKLGRTQWKQWLATISATLSMIAVGTVYGWTTTILSRMIDGKNVPFRITDDEGSWIVSLTVIGSMIGPFIGAWLATRYGRKFCLLISSIFYIVGWIMIILASDVTTLYVSRIVLGIGVGISYTANPIYVSEVADTNIRGALSTLIAVNVFTGSLLACSVGPWVTTTNLGIILLTVPIIFVATFIWFPESPYYLVTKGRNDEALKSIIFFKGIDDHEEAMTELDLITKNINENVEEDEKLRDRLRRLFSVNNRRAFVIVLGLIVAQQLSGNFSTMQYMHGLFSSTNIAIDPDIATIIVLAVALVSGAMSTGLVENAGRRLLLVISTIGSSLTLGILAFYIFIDSRYQDLSSINALPIIAVIMFQITYQIGLGTLPNALIGELFPTSAKGIAGAAITVSDGILGFAVSKTYQVINDVVKNSYTNYFFFASCCALAFVFVLLFVPETKSKSFGDIQNELAKGSLVFRRRIRRVNDCDVIA